MIAKTASGKYVPFGVQAPHLCAVWPPLDLVKFSTLALRISLMYSVKAVLNSCQLHSISLSGKRLFDH